MVRLAVVGLGKMGLSHLCHNQRSSARESGSSL